MAWKETPKPELAEDTPTSVAIRALMQLCESLDEELKLDAAKVLLNRQ